MSAWKIAGGVAICTVCFVPSLQHTFGLHQYKKNLIQYTKIGKEKSLDDDTAYLIERVKSEMRLKSELVKNIQFFVSSENHPFHRGDVKGSLNGAIIGLPPNFVYKSPSDVPKENLTVGKNQNVIDWDSEEGKDLQNSMVFSEGAKAFAIGREINYTNTFHVYTEVLMKITAASFTTVPISYIEDMLKSRQSNRLWRNLIRLGAYPLIGTAIFLLYLTGSDMYHCHRDIRVDQKTAALSGDFAAGGLEFYQKIIQRNKALRSIMGREGEEFYTVNGNEMNYLWGSENHTSLPFTTRLERLKKYISKLEEAQTVE